MKLLRPLLLLLGIVTLLLAVTAGLALIPSVQGWAVRRALARHPGLDLQFAEISAGPASAVVRGVRYAQGGVTVRAESVAADYSLAALLFSSRIDLGRLAVRGLEIDAAKFSRRRAEAGAAVAPAATPGALGRVTLPYEIALGVIDVQGRAQLPGAAGKPAVQADFQLTGGGIAPGRDGTLHLKSRLKDPSVSARVGALQLQVDLQLRQTLQHTFDRIGLNALVDAEGPGLSGHDQLKLAAELVRATNGENYRIRLDTVQSGTSSNLLTLNATLPTASQGYRGDWSLTARSAQVEPFFLGGALPRFDLHGQGEFTFNPEAREGSLQGALRGEVSGLEALRPTLRPIGDLRFQGRVDLAVAKDVARLNQLELSVAGENPVLDLRASGAAAFNFKERQLQLGGTAAGEVLRLKLLGLPVAWVRPFLTVADVSGGQLTGEVVLLNVDGRKLVAVTPTPLAVDGLTIVRSGRALLSQGGLLVEAETELSASTIIFRLSQLQLRTPAGDRVAVKGTVTAPLGQGAGVVLAASGEASIPTLLHPWFPGLNLQGRGETDLTWQGGRLELRKLSLEADDAKGRQLAAIAVSRPFTVDLRQHTFDTGGGEAELATLRCAPLPLALLLRQLPGYAISGETGPVELSLRGADHHLSLQVKAPVRVTNLGVKVNGQPFLDKVSLDLSPLVELTDGQVSRISSGEMVLREMAGTEIGNLTAELARVPEGGQRGALTFKADLAALSSQGGFASLATLVAGRAGGEVRTLASAGARRIEARATLNGLVLREGNQVLPVANLSLRADTTPDGHLTLQAPILLDRSGVRTDLNFTLEGSRAGQVVNFDAKLAGEHADLADTLLLIGALGSPLGGEPDGAAAQARALAPPTADARAFWTGFNGQVALDLKSVTRGALWSMNGLTGRLVVGPDRVQLQKLEADFGEKSRLAAQGDLSFAAGPNPYSLKGDFSLTEFDAGKLFKALEPGRPPTVEGLFTVAGHADGQGLTLADTIDRLRGQFQLTSRQGVFRGLKRTSDKLSVASKAVELSAALGSIFGSDRVKQTAEKMAGHSYQIDQLAQMLAEFNYDQLSLRMVREPSLNVLLQKVSLVSPEIRLLGSGQVSHVAGTQLLEQPLNLKMAIAARGKLETLLGRMRELDGSRDELGYAKAKNPITVGGTLARPDPLPYFGRMAASKLSDYLTPDN